MFSQDQWLASTGVAFYNGVATQSLRFDSGSSNYLEWTPSASSTSTRTFTVSTWVKLGNLKTGSDSFIWCGQNVSGTTNCDLNFKTSGGEYYFQIGASGNSVKNTSELRRDVSAWYHLVAVFDTTQGTDTNRRKLYVNGEQRTISGTFPSQNTDFDIGGSNKQMIGALNLGSAGRFFDGYIGEFNFVDGQALDPTSFGEFKNGVWIAKKYTGSYGTNGFRLQFNQTGTGTASASTIGADTSGNTNHFTSSGIVSSDCSLLDSPENNWCTLNPLDAVLTSTTISEGNLQTNQNVDSDKATLKATFGVSSGKWYWEGRVIFSDDSNINIGVVTDSASVNNVVSGDYTYLKQMENLMSVGDIFQIALNMDAGAWYIGLNNTWYNGATASEISAGNTTNAEDTGLSGTFLPAFYETAGGSGVGFTANFGQDDTFAGAISSGGNTDGNGIGVFKYTPPSGFLALCTSNLPEPTISPNADTQADDYFNTILYNGDGNTTQDVTGVGFAPDWTWIKERSSSSGHVLADSSRGYDKYLASNETIDEGTGVLNSRITTGTGGFQTTNSGATNQSSQTYVAWNWKANGGTTSSNTDGSITSTVQASTDAGFSIVTWTGNATLPTTIGHGLGKQPLVLIVKNRDDDSTNWFVHHHKTALGSTAKDYLNLNTTGADANSNDIWGQTRPTTSVFTVGANNQVNGSGDAMIAYCFAEIEGYSKFGSYTGNGSTDGTFVYTGFRPAFVLIKQTSASGNNWRLYDNTRQTFNVIGPELYPSSADTEADNDRVDFLSNGLKFRATHSSVNDGTHIYMAFAEAPFKYANAR